MEHEHIRIAFMGASGTGKTTLARKVEAELGLPFNPIGSRSVAKAMGFANPYDVDAAGQRGPFQRRLVTDKRAWEDEHDSFISDRTTLDNLAYTMLHDVYAVDAELLEAIVEGMNRYTHVVFFPVDVFIDLGGDKSRVGGGEHGKADDLTYHHLYELTLEALLKRYRPEGLKLTKLYTDDLDKRLDWVQRHIEGREPMQE